MRRETDSKTKETLSKEQLVDSSKLVSLLALAAGAVAMPETGNASIVYTNLANPGMVNFSNPSFTITLPGNAQLGFQEIRTGVTAVTSTRRIAVGKVAGYVLLKTHSLYAVHVHVNNPASTQVAWNQIPAVTGTMGKMGKATISSFTPAGYDHDYLPFAFRDSTQGNQLRYGWVDISFSNSKLQAGGQGGPAATIWAYAYDDSGAQILMGQTAVPEPASTSLMALGAMALGARGVRAWRKRKNF